MASPERLIVGLSGASGAILGVRLLEALAGTPVETHLVMTRTAETTLAYETDLKAAAVRELADAVHPVGDLGAAISSGSFRALGMIVAPCSARTLSEIAAGTTSNLLTRAADVALKERRTLVLGLRETPLHVGHLRNMVAVAEMGAVVAPPMPAFYARPESVGAMVDQTVGRWLDLFGIETPLVRRWDDLRRTRKRDRGAVTT